VQQAPHRIVEAVRVPPRTDVSVHDVARIPAAAGLWLSRPGYPNIFLGNRESGRYCPWAEAATSGKRVPPVAPTGMGGTL
jgi:hypothetical protein